MAGVTGSPGAGARIGKLVVIGVGLIGGSFALALRAAGCVGTVVGVGRTRANLDVALAQGIADRVHALDEDWTRELADADLVLFATPVAQLPGLFAAAAGKSGAATVLTDAGSTKQDVVAAARAHLGGDISRFVPAHPVSGTEKTGAGAAFPTLYQDRIVVVTPVPETAPEAVAVVESAWRATGARLRRLEPALHDRILAGVSHLPHLLAFALVDSIARRRDAAEYFSYAAGGFRDFTRIAASSPEMWRDIAVANRAALLEELAAFRTQLDELSRLVDAGDAAGLQAIFARASDARRQWGQQHPVAAPGAAPGASKEER